jgi:hypothetical protein
MRSNLAWIVVVLLVMAAANLFWWQHYQIAGFRAQLAEQEQVLAERSADPSGFSRSSEVASASWRPRATSGGMIRADLPRTEARGEDRNLILDQYQDAIAQLNLPPATASRLRDLLANRVQAILDAEDSARREGYAEASAVAQQAVALAIAQEDQRIVQLIGLVGERRLDGQGPASADATYAAAPTTAVVLNLPPAPTPDSSAVQAAYCAANYATYPSYPYLYSYPSVYYSSAGYLNYGRAARSYPAQRFAPARSFAHTTFAAHSGARRR